MLSKLYPQAVKKSHPVFQTINERLKSTGNTGPVGKSPPDQQGSWSMLRTSTQTISTKQASSPHDKR